MPQEASGTRLSDITSVLTLRAVHTALRKLCDSYRVMSPR